MPGEVYSENSSDDAQGYQSFTTYSSNYLTLFLSNVYLYICDNVLQIFHSKGGIPLKDDHEISMLE